MDIRQRLGRNVRRLREEKGWSQEDYADRAQGVRGMVIDFMTPETETTHHYFWGMARNFDIDDAGFTARFRAQQGGVFAEDKVILEAQQRAIAANPDLRLTAYAIDQGGVRARQIIARAMKAGLEYAR